MQPTSKRARYKMALTKQEIIDRIKESTGWYVGDRLIVKVLDYSNNPLAPEPVAYKLSWISAFSGKRERCVYYPNTVGLQFCK
ncbi:hypothetical protein PBI_121Q_315 [Escherichia phage 121Q]|uniref:Uncharacterized protein n=1 Tax=Escherichia phage 121Q TaxID=1555202 RepID=A0A097EXS3_9CAUD|nr:hypothetical protein PBI_121Q_315 [Escherichia phage 121Q]AIT14205.1 hypothetical protein PBI_121Q_315 [Escherichia phage 121Q]